MKNLRATLFATCLLGGALTSRSQIFLDSRWTTFNSQPSIAVPDMNLGGVTDTETISLGAAYNKLASISIFVDVEADFDGDLYAYVQHGSTYAVLLNRPGRTTGNTFGYADKGFTITLRDGAPNGDVHNYQNVMTPATGTKLMGTWQPDARAVDPRTSLSTSQRTAFLSAFQGQDPNGEWTLFVADSSSGGTAKILEWGVIVTAVPEPRATAAFIASVLVAFASYRKLRELGKFKPHS